MDDFAKPIDGEAIRQFALRANLGGVAACITFLASVTPYAFVSDCRANLATSGIVDVIKVALMLYLLSATFASTIVGARMAYTLGEIIVSAATHLYMAIRAAIGPALFIDKETACKEIAQDIAHIIRKTRAREGGKFHEVGVHILRFSELYFTKSETILACIAIVAFFYSSITLSREVFHLFERDNIVKTQEQFSKDCAFLQLLPMNANGINPYMQVNPMQ